MSNVRWEPVGDGYEHRTERQAVRVYGDQLQSVRLDPEGPGYDVWTNITLPPDVRLCRAGDVEPPQWSQEPGDDYPFQWPMSIAVRTALGELCDEIFLARHGDVVMEHYGKLVRNWLLKLPATVPQPVTWSQEPPDAPGWWYFHERGNDDVVDLVFVLPGLTEYTVIDEDGGVYQFGVRDFTGYWSRHNMPQPPGEVGP